MRLRKVFPKIIWTCMVILFSMGFPTIVTLFFSMYVEKTEDNLPKCGKYVIAEGERMDAEEYLVGILAAENIGEEKEAYQKTICVIYRTLLYGRLEAEEEVRAETLGYPYMDEQERREAWEETFEQKETMLKTTVAETYGMVLKEGDGLARPQMHELSNGFTREGISCPEDVKDSGYLKTAVYSNEAFLAMLQQLNPQVMEDGASLLSLVQISRKDAYGYVEELTIGGMAVAADDFMEKFQLMSPSFELDAYNGGIRILTKGEGSGYGLSRNYAAFLANEGKTEQEILKTFFPQMDIKK